MELVELVNLVTTCQGHIIELGSWDGGVDKVGQWNNGDEGGKVVSLPLPVVPISRRGEGGGEGQHHPATRGGGTLGHSKIARSRDI